MQIQKKKIKSTSVKVYGKSVQIRKLVYSTNVQENWF